MVGDVGDDGSGAGGVGEDHPLDVGGRPVAAGAEPMDIAGLEPGDLVFVEADRTRLGHLIGELDGCRFSHVGVLWDPAEATMVSARTDRRGGLHRPDLGGVRVDALAPLADRGLWAAPLVVDGQRRARALDRLGAWCEAATPVDPTSRSRFSFAKLVAVSVALASVRRRDPHEPDDAERLWTAALDAAEALSSGGPAPRGAGDGTPGFYCAELVAAAFGLRHHAPSFPVSDGEPHPAVAAGAERGRNEVRGPLEDVPDRDRLPDRTGRTDGADVPEAIVRLGSRSLPGRWWSMLLAVVRALDEADLSAEQLSRTVDLLATVVTVDPALAIRLLAAAAELRGDPEVPAPIPPLPSEPYRRPEFVRDGHVLPTALVTPRMLLAPALVASVRPLRLPDG